MSFFDESLQGMDPKIAREHFANEARCRADVKDELYTEEEAEFINAAIDNLAEEIKDVKSFDKIKMNQKARIIAFMSFIYDILEEGSDFDDEFLDEDFEEEEEEEDEDDEPKGKKNKEDRILSGITREEQQS